MSTKRIAVLFLVFAVVFVSGQIARAEVKPNPLFSDGMVLQQDLAAPVWGTADAGEEITVTIADQKATGRADDSGQWLVKLKPLSARGPHTMTIAGSNTVHIKDVLVGHVWVCSGQSNMGWSVEQSANPKEEIQAANYPEIRLFTVNHAIASKPLKDLTGQWSACTPESAKTFSAVAYFFGRKLHKDLDAPIGLIHSSWGGTPAESWTRLDVLEANEQLKPGLKEWDDRIANHRQKLASYLSELNNWIIAGHEAEANGTAVPGPAPVMPKDPRQDPHRPTGLFNAMINPLIPYAISGAIWYQGESNAGRAYDYRTLFPAMITNWRQAWNQGDFPFLFVQLANFRLEKPVPAESEWAELREAQLKTLSLPNTAMAVIIDIGEANDIHPKNKQDVGNRLALAAEAIACKKDVVYSGPIYDKMTVEDGAIKLTFKHIGGGLVARGSDLLQGFAIAGKDRRFVWANAAIVGDTVVVSHPNVTEPVAVRYAWADNPKCNLYNKEGLPASPFRTDDFPMVTKRE